MTDPTTHPDAGTDLRTLMDRALADLTTPTDRLRAASVARGRATRRRRRAGTLLGALAATAVVAGIALPSLAGTEGAEGTVAHDTGTSRTELYEPPPGWWDMPGQEMRDRLTGLLPAGLAVTDANLGDQDLAPGESPAGGWLQVDLTDGGAPAGGLNVVLYAPAPDDGEFLRERTTCPGNLEDPDACTELRDPDGSVLGRTSRWAAQGVVVVEVTRRTPEGGLVYVAASNSSDEKWGLGSATDRRRPPVDTAELRAIAADPTWQRWTPPAG